MPSTPITGTFIPPELPARPHRRLSRRARFGIAALPAFAATIVVIAGYSAVERARGATDRVEQTRRILEVSDSVMSRALDAETGQRAFVITRDSAFLQPYAGAYDDVRGAIRTLRQLLAGDTAQMIRVDRLSLVLDQRFTALASILDDLRQPGWRPTTDRFRYGKELMDSARHTIDSIQTEEARALAARRVQARSAVDLSRAILIIGGILVVVCAILVNRFLSRAIASETKAAVELEKSNTRLIDATQELEAVNEELSAQTEELTAQTEELEHQASELQTMNDLLVEAARDLEKARRAADVANVAKSEFLATMSHELRTPLNAIAGYVGLLREEGLRGPLNANQKRDLDRLHLAQSNLSTLINDILDFSKIEAGKVEYDITEVKVEEIVTAATTMIAPQAAAKSIVIDRTSVDGCGIVVLADPHKLQQILVNLLSNAVKFTDANGSITLDCSATDGRATVTVRDTGIGIPADKLEAIFDPFVQAARRPTSATAGTGLGLSISRELARGMGGDLRAESVERGSTLVLTIPLRGAP